MRAVNLAAISAIVVSQLAATPLMAQDNRNLPPPGYGDAQEFEGTLRCASYNNRPQNCAVNTENRVVLLQREAGNCRQNYDWGYDRSRIWVNNRCVAVFGYGYAYNRPQPPSGNWGDRNFAGTLQCTSRGRNQERCYVNTENRVELLREDSRCVAGQSWGYTNDFIWVSNRCSAVFGYGNAYRPQPQPPGNKGPSAGAIIGGVIVAGGLLALLANSKKKTSAPATSQPAKPEFPPQPPAAISADLTKIEAGARPTVQNCLFEAARQIGATGGSRLAFEKATKLEKGNGGWRLTAAASANYPDGTRATPFFCRATPTQVIELSFTG